MSIVRELTALPFDASAPLSAIVRVETLAPGNRVLLRGYYYRVAAVECLSAEDTPGGVVDLELQDIGRRRFAVGSVLPCERRP